MMIWKVLGRLAVKAARRKTAKTIVNYGVDNVTGEDGFVCKYIFGIKKFE